MPVVQSVGDGMVDVFISYSRDNKARVAQIADAVTRAGYDVWWDAELPPHRSYGDVITEKITGARAAIVVWSHSAAASEWVRAEADVARQQKKLIQTAIDDVMPPLPFNQIQFADISDWQGQDEHSGWRKIKMSLVDLCGARSGEAVAAPPPPIHAPEPIASPRAAAPDPAPQGRNRNLLLAVLAVAALVIAALVWRLLGSSDAPAAPMTASGNMVDAAPDAPGDAAGDTMPAERFTLAAVINDSDGFSNIRARPSQASDVVGKVLEGEKFLTYPQKGTWWRVRKADGTNGFMARRLIRVLDGPSPDPAPPVDGGTDDIMREGGPPPAPMAPDSTDNAALVPAASGYGAIIPGSSRRALTSADIAGLSAVELKLARNEIFARKGMRFKDARLAAHFAQFDWYRPTRDAVALNELEKANVALLRAAESGR
ncbi:MAG: hypothetical protein RLZZ58_1509 [Pseudomonadota bacterium]